MSIGPHRHDVPGTCLAHHVCGVQLLALVPSVGLGTLGLKVKSGYECAAVLCAMGSSERMGGHLWVSR